MNAWDAASAMPDQGPYADKCVVNSGSAEVINETNHSLQTH